MADARCTSCSGGNVDEPWPPICRTGSSVRVVSRANPQSYPRSRWRGAMPAILQRQLRQPRAAVIYQCLNARTPNGPNSFLRSSVLLAAASETGTAVSLEKLYGYGRPRRTHDRGPPVVAST